MSNNKAEIKIGERLFYISTYCYAKVGETENLKFKLECATDSRYNREFDDYEELRNYLTDFLWSDICKEILGVL